MLANLHPREANADEPPRTRSNRAQSEVVGVVLLVGVFATVAIIAGVLIVGNVTDQAREQPRAEFNVTADDANVTLVHAGGDRLAIEDVDVVVRRSDSKRIELSGFTELSGDGDDRFESGERRRFSHGFGAGQLDVLLVHTPSNSVVYETTVDARAPTPDSDPITNEEARPRIDYSPSTPTTGETITFDASNSIDPDGTITSYEWDWTDDGSFEGSGRTATHAYPSTGTYTVRLRVTDDQSAENTTSVSVTVSPSDTTAPSITGYSASNPTGRDVQISFTSSEPLDAIDVSISGAETATLTRADLTGSGSGPYTYTGTYSGSSDGTYTATLDTAADAAGNDGASAQSDSVTVDTTAPTAEAGPDRTVAEGEPVTFDGSGSTDNLGISGYAWNFDGDGTTDATGISPSHSYSTAGTYTVTLTVTDSAGHSDTDTLDVTVTPNTDPSASFTYSPTVPETGQQITFDASGSTDSDGTIQTYAWDFDGDGTTDATGETVTHRFDSGGDQQVSLTVTDDDTATDTTTQTVFVDAPPVATFTYTRSGGQVTFDASGSYDPDGGDLGSFAYTWYVNGTFQGWGETITMDVTDDTTPSSVALVVQDDEGTTNSTSQQLPYTVSVPGFGAGAVVLAMLLGGWLLRRE